MPSEVDRIWPKNLCQSKLAGPKCLCPWNGRVKRQARKLELAPDPIRFARSLGFHPDPVQSEILRTPARQILLLMGRQCGKSTIAALRAVHLAVTQPGAQILTAGRVGRQSSEFLLKVRAFLRRLNLSVQRDGVNQNSILLPNGSRFIPVPGTHQNIRGFSAVHLLVIDEAAYAPDDLYYALRPMLAVTNGAVMLLSTANGCKGFFYSEWTSGSPAWARFQQLSTECPRISSDFLERERATHPDRWFRQEYLCEFLDSAGTLFRSDKLRACITHSIQARNL